MIFNFLYSDSTHWRARLKSKARVKNYKRSLYEHFPFMFITLFTPSIYGTTVGTYPTKHKPGGLSNELKY